MSSNNRNFYISNNINSNNIYLPSLNSNLQNHPVFCNNTEFISNTKAFYEDLDRILEDNEEVLMKVQENSLLKIEKFQSEQ